MRILITASKVLAHLRSDGLSGTADIVRKNLIRETWYWLNRRFDRKHDVDTAGSIQPGELEIESANRVFGIRYEPTPVRTFKNLMTNLPADLSAYTFVDYGSGKGRVLLLAAAYKFRRIVGVEYATDLHRIAELNLHRYCGPRACADVHAVCADASEFPIPDGPCVFYFFQPFTLDVMVAVLNRIKASYLEDSRPMYLLFLHPHPFAIQELERLAFTQKLPTKPLPRDYEWMYARELALYRAHP